MLIAQLELAANVLPQLPVSMKSLLPVNVMLPMLMVAGPLLMNDNVGFRPP